MPEREGEQTTEELVRELIENRDGRYVLIGPSDRVNDGRAIIFDVVTRMVTSFDDNDGELQKEVVKQMLRAGVRVLPGVPPAVSKTEKRDIT